MQTISDKSNYLPPGSDTVVATAAGGIVAIVLSTLNTSTPQLVTFYDAAAFPASDILFQAYVMAPQPLVLVLPQSHQMRFGTGLCVNTPNDTRGFVVTYE